VTITATLCQRSYLDAVIDHDLMLAWCQSLDMDLINDHDLMQAWCQRLHMDIVNDHDLTLALQPTVAVVVALQAVQQDPRVTQLVKDLSQSIQAAADDTGENMPALLVLNKVCRASICLCIHHALILSMQGCHHNAIYPADLSETDMPCVICPLQTCLFHGSGLYSPE